MIAAEFKMQLTAILMGEVVAMTKKLEVELFSFSELSEKSQRNVYSDEYDDFVNSIFFDHELETHTESFKDWLREEWGASEIEVLYDISYSQGDGCCCTAYLDVEEVLTKLDFWQELADEINNGNLTIDDITIIRAGRSNFYCHERTCWVAIKWDYDYDNGEECYEYLLGAITDVEYKIYDILEDKLLELKRDLYGAYESTSSFESFSELYSENDSLYFENGKRADFLIN